MKHLQCFLDSGPILALDILLDYRAIVRIRFSFFFVHPFLHCDGSLNLVTKFKNSLFDSLEIDFAESIRTFFI